MNERLRVTLGILLLLGLIGGFIASGVIALQRDDDQATTYIDSNIIDNNINTTAQEATTLQRVAPAEVGFDTERLSLIDSIVECNIRHGELSGCVVGVVRHGKIAFSKAYGNDGLSADAQPITLDTRFDLASLTKPIATATATMQLVEQGRLPLAARIDRYIEGFEGWCSKEDRGDTTHLRIVDLLAHCSGLPPYVSIERLRREYDDAEHIDKEIIIDYISHCQRRIEPRSETLYSCLGYIVLGSIVERVTGIPLDEYCQRHIFTPLGMHNTCYLPDEEYASLCAPTLIVNNIAQRGSVHDPLTREVMGGVSGNAGLFSTLDDVAIYAATILGGGEWRGERILSKRSVATMLSQPRVMRDSDRTLCFAKVGGYSGLFGDLVTDSAIGHSGATGTSLVIDPELDLAIIILSNRVLTVPEGSLTPMRSAIASVVLGAVEE